MINNKNDVEKIIYNGKLVRKLNVNNNNVNSEAYLYRWLGNQYVVRKVGKQYNLSTKQLVVLEKDICTYYLLLKKLLSNNLPKIFFTKIDKQQNAILLVTEYFPKGKIAETKSISQKVKYFKAVSNLIVKLVRFNRNRGLDKLICSIDTNPENFFLNKKGKIIYNDFTPPLFLRENEIWFEFRRKDEMHVLKSEKEKRYFSDVNLFLNFINKVRIYLPFNEYVKFIKWVSKIKGIKPQGKPWTRKELAKARASPATSCGVLNLSIRRRLGRCEREYSFTRSSLVEIIKAKKSVNNLSIFPKIFEEISQKPTIESCYKFKNDAGARDLLRFSVSLNRELTENKVKEIYKESKKRGGVLYLEKKLKKLNKN